MKKLLQAKQGISLEDKLELSSLIARVGNAAALAAPELQIRLREYGLKSETIAVASLEAHETLHADNMIYSTIRKAFSAAHLVVFNYVQCIGSLYRKKIISKVRFLRT